MNPFIVYTNGRFDLSDNIKLAWSGCTILYYTGFMGQGLEVFSNLREMITLS